MGCTHSAVVRTNSRASSCLIPLRSDADRSSGGFSGPWSSPKVTVEVGTILGNGAKGVLTLNVPALVCLRKKPLHLGTSGGGLALPEEVPL